MTFSCKESSGYALFGKLMALLIVCESVPLSFALWHRHPIVEVFLFVVNVYTLFWFAGIVRAANSGAIEVDEQYLKIRMGRICRADILRSDILSCRRVEPTDMIPRARDYLRLVVLNDPQYLIELSRPAYAIGLYGRKREFTRVGVAVDDPNAFAAVLHPDR